MKAIQFRSLSIKTLITSLVLFAAMFWLDRNDPDPFDGGNIILFLLIAVVSQAISLAFFKGNILLNTYPHILSNVIAAMTVIVTAVLVLFD